MCNSTPMAAVLIINLVTIAHLVQLRATVEAITSKLSVINLWICARFDIILEVLAADQIVIIVWVFRDPF